MIQALKHGLRILFLFYFFKFTWLHSIQLYYLSFHQDVVDANVSANGENGKDLESEKAIYLCADGSKQGKTN